MLFSVVFASSMLICLQDEAATPFQLLSFLYNDNKALITQMISAQTYSCSLDHDLNSVERYYAD